MVFCLVAMFAYLIRSTVRPCIRGGREERIHQPRNDEPSAYSRNGKIETPNTLANDVKIGSATCIMTEEAQLAMLRFRNERHEVKMRRRGS